ncbi:MAG: stage II sporulation protein M [Planctomycetales bacterium]|nr:stage II sporulation protein M [Planctomycetales bacterium]
MANLAETLEKRREDWLELEKLIKHASARSLRHSRGDLLLRLSDRYRSACADLAMAEQYQLSQETIGYLHGLVGRAHNAIYRSTNFQWYLWWDIIFRQAPQQIFNDRCVQISAVLFFGLFSLSTYLAYDEQTFPGFAERMLGAEQISAMEDSFSDIEFGRSIDQNLTMVAFYIQHNTGIGLQCFAMGPLIIPGLYTTGYNATTLGASFGYMARADTSGGDNFLEFVTAHGAFELTAIALAAAAGLRIGTGWLFTRGLTRVASLEQRAREAIPVMAVSGVLFFLAALTEGMLSPSAVPYFFKAMWGVFSSSLMMFYFVVLGYPNQQRAAGDTSRAT